MKTVPKIELCSMKEYIQIINEIGDFWGNDRTVNIHHPCLLHEFGNTAFVIKDDAKVIAYLFGFYSQTQNCAYVHLVAVREQFQQKGYGTLLYKHFIERAQSQKSKKLKAITKPDNYKSINFHKNKIGMLLLGEPNEDGITVVKNYSGENEDRVVFEKNL